jgi:hypothetical protein
MKDWIISGKTGETYAEVEIRRDEGIDYFYVGEIVKYDFPSDLASLIDEYDELVNACVLSLLDEVEEKIYSYDLKLKVLGKRIFSLSIKEKLKITFFTKYPTSKGFVGNHPF